jgi:hypothetical protein
MAAEPSLDPFALVRDLVAKIEKGINESANPLLKSGEFSRVANKVMSAATVAKKLAQDLTQRYFEALNVPSRTDIVALGDRLQALEDRMIVIQATLDQMGAPARRAALPAPSRTRKPPPSIDAAVMVPPPVVAKSAAKPARTRRAARS